MGKKTKTQTQSSPLGPQYLLGGRLSAILNPRGSGSHFLPTCLLQAQQAVKQREREREKQAKRNYKQ